MTKRNEDFVSWKEIFVGIIIVIVFVSCICWYYKRTCRIFKEEHPGLRMENCQWWDEETGKWRLLRDL